MLGTLVLCQKVVALLTALGATAQHSVNLGATLNHPTLPEATAHAPLAVTQHLQQPPAACSSPATTPDFLKLPAQLHQPPTHLYQPPTHLYQPPTHLHINHPRTSRSTTHGQHTVGNALHYQALA